MLTDQEIDALFDEHRWSPSEGYYPVVRAIEQAATAPLLARIAEIEAELEKTKAIFAASCNHVAVMEMDRDARRYRWLRDHGFQHAVVCLGTDLDGDNFVSYRIDFNLPEPAHMKFEDDEWGTADVDAAIDAAMKEQGHV